MNPILRAGVMVVQLALLSYTVGTVLEQRGRRVTAAVRRWLTVGVVFDVIATACMILGTNRPLITLHGVLGYSALAAMLVDMILLRRHARAHGEAPVPRRLHLYSRFAYLWWVVAYVTGGALVMMSRRG
jgi:hypothetical protein